MSRLTVKKPSGEWRLAGVEWEELGELRPKVYGALCKLLTMEDLIDEINRALLRMEGTGYRDLAVDYLLRDLLNMATYQDVPLFSTFETEGCDGQ